jgi:Protein of unknown function (DUF3631)
MNNVINFDASANNNVLDQLVVDHDQRQGDLMLRAVYEFCGRFIAYPSKHAHVAHVLWIVHCHLMDSWDTTPRLAFLSAEKESGKTRALEITELVVPRPIQTMNVTPAYLFRKISSDDGLPTILFDEVDTIFTKAGENEELRGLLNAGYRRGAIAGRCVMRGKTVELEELPAYAPVALAGIGWLPDTVLSRSIIIRMRRRASGEQVESFRRRIHSIEGQRVRDRIEAWAAGQPGEIEWPKLPPGIEDRNADMWEPLIAVADLAGGDWPERARAAAVTLVTALQDAEPSLGVRLLMDMRTVFEAGGMPAHMRSPAILTELQGIEESPWRDLKGKPLEERGLARLLRQYGIKSKVVRIGEATQRGYAKVDLMDAWERYLPSISPGSVTSETYVTGRPVTDRVGAKDPSNSNPRYRCYACYAVSGQRSRVP